MSKVTRTTEGLRNVLFDEMDMFLAGTVDSEHADTVQKLSGAILKTVAKDLEAKKMLEGLRAGSAEKIAISDLNLNIVLSSEVNEA